MEILIGAALALLVAVVSFRHQKRWERKVDAYDRVVNALHDVLDVRSSDMEDVAKGRLAPAKREAIEVKMYWKAKKEIARAYSLGGYLLPLDAKDRLGRYLKEAAVAANTADLTEMLNGSIKAAHNCLMDVIDIAERDLSLLPWRRPFRRK